MSDLTDIIRILPPMKSGNELRSSLEVLPEYDNAICDADVPIRLMALKENKPFGRTHKTVRLFYFKGGFS